MKAGGSVMAKRTTDGRGAGASSRSSAAMPARLAAMRARNPRPASLAKDVAA